MAPGVGAAGGAAGAAQADATAAPGGAAAAAGAAGAGKSVLLGNPELQSPFGPGAPVSDVLAGGAGAAPAAGQPEKEVISAAEAARRQKMAALGYMVPPDYYSKDLKTLRMLAKGGDAYAMVHLGEKYYFELNGNKANPEYDSGTDYALAAKQSFKEALAAGNIRSAGIIAELYLQENNLAEAYAWHLVSERMGDSISADWFRSTKAAQQASDGLKREAGARAAKITAELNGMKRKAA
ncbi:hypothetical protein [Janthinobacterium fluminis]|uniref:Sel1 repeat family protein n=1 Tax=Janthinobacterium fluminis TaxID=2987524 RepID=A0ABT5JWF4_9BURK|nr:hypothetical protein [Janthinobacterium fluminis]MDC8756401.1 hypothetical protein [Janthinobacterium fluminis]